MANCWQQYFHHYREKWSERKVYGGKKAVLVGDSSQYEWTNQPAAKTDYTKLEIYAIGSLPNLPDDQWMAHGKKIDTPNTRLLRMRKKIVAAVAGHIQSIYGISTAQR